MAPTKLVELRIAAFETHRLGHGKRQQVREQWRRLQRRLQRGQLGNEQTMMGTDGLCQPTDFQIKRGNEKGPIIKPLANRRGMPITIEVIPRGQEPKCVKYLVVEP